jgi:hypothetical protein
MSWKHSRPLTHCDFTHFDIPDFADAIPEAFEMVGKGFLTEQDFREFTFTNAAMLHTRNNPGFFKGTVVEQAVADELGLERTSPAATA